MPAFEYMRLLLHVRGCQVVGPGAEQFADVQGLDAMLAALGADGWELIISQPSDSDVTTYLFKREVG
jgi:hypothetical protein